MPATFEGMNHILYNRTYCFYNGLPGERGQQERLHGVVVEAQRCLPGATDRQIYLVALHVSLGSSYSCCQFQNPRWLLATFLAGWHGDVDPIDEDDHNDDDAWLHVDCS